LRYLSGTLVLLLLAGALGGAAAGSPAIDQARGAALKFGQALKGGEVSHLRDILPAQGKVRLNLHCLGPAEGFFSAGQVEALLREFLEQGSIRSFDLIGLEHDPQHFAIAHGRSLLTDREGRPARIDIYLSFQPEGDRWVLREVRETEP
jgi:hypothetical protein